MDESQMRSLLLWVQSFEDSLASDIQVVSLDDLCDGVFLSKIMHHIDPEYLKLEQISEVAGGNWALKANNLKTLVRAVELFYNDELGQLCNASELIDTVRIAKENDVHEVCKLVELILGCAVQGPSKSDYILPIMQMDASEQASLMQVIEGLMRRFQQMSPAARRNSASRGASFSYSDSGSGDVAAQLAQATEKSAAMELKYLDIERENRALTERFENALAEHHQLVEKYNALEEERNKLIYERQNSMSRDNKKIQQLVESEVHSLTLALEEKNEELQRVKRESTERLMVLENEVRRQADELDISRSKLGQMTKLEASVMKYKKKLEEMNTLRTQVKELETHNAQYLDKVLDLESTIKTMPTLKALVEKYKNQVVELETANVEAKSSLRIKDEKNRRLQEELDSALGGKEFLESQVEELRTQVASLQHHQSQDEDFSTAAAVGSGGISADVLLGRDAVGSLRERVARLERENAELRGARETPDQTQLANELDLALKAKEALQNTVYQLQMKNEQLSEEMRTGSGQLQLVVPPQNQVEANGPQPMEVSMGEEGYAAMNSGRMGVTPSLPSSYAAGSTSESITLHPNAGASGAIVKQGDSGLSAAQVAEYEAQINRLKEQAEAVESMRATVTELTNRLKEKESVINEVTEQRTKLENYTKKTLHAVQTKYMVAVSSQRNQLNEKEERVEFLEKKLKEARNSFSREQALMMSSFYEIGTEMQRRTMMPQGPGAGPAAGWLASKRTEERAKRRQL